MKQPVSDKEYNQRPLKQNRALHLYFRQVSELLNDAGLDMRVILKPTVEIAWTPESVKEYLWRPVMKIQLQKKSTVMMTTKDIDTIYDTLNMLLGRKGLHVQFPSWETYMREKLEQKKINDRKSKR